MIEIMSFYLDFEVDWAIPLITTNIFSNGFLFLSIYFISCTFLIGQFLSKEYNFCRLLYDLMALKRM